MTIKQVRKDGQSHTNGIENFWALLKRSCYGTSHQMNAKRLPRCINEIAGQHTVRQRDTANQMAFIAKCFIRKRLRYQELVSG